MLWINLKRIVKTGFVNFWRNGFISLSTVLVMTVTLFVIGSVIFLSVILRSSLTELKQKVDVNVYFVTSAPEDGILTIKKSLEALPEVLGVEYVSKDRALENFKKRHENDTLTLQAIAELGDNPLGAVLNVKAKETSQYEGIAKFLESKTVLSKDGASIIDKVNYYQNKIAIDKLTQIIDSAERLGVAVTVILAILSILITFNTIRLIIYISREEISVMKLVGASNKYIRGPFMISGIMYGLFSGIVTLVIFYPLTYSLGKVSANFFAGINIFNYYISNFWQVSLIILGVGVVLGAISSVLAVSKYLKV
ncbi:MAG: permease-like cell division protein FtsX [Candidatus Paceibacterota bacterium]|jgi:cell division transport system permease protein